MSLYQVLDNYPNAYSSYSMDARLVLERQGNVSFTNLDQISGKVVLRSQKSLDLDGIVVKLEGESRTRLLSPAGPGEKQKPQLEYHKVRQVCRLISFIRVFCAEVGFSSKSYSGLRSVT